MGVKQMKGCACLLGLSLLLATSPLFCKTYSASGLVLRTDREHLSLEVSCQGIPGYMEAMVMTFPVRSAEALDGLKPGMMIDFKLDVRKNAAYAEQIRIHAYENTAQEPMAARQLEILDAATAPSSRTGPVLLVGQDVTDFTLTDQRRKSVPVSDFKG